MASPRRAQTRPVNSSDMQVRLPPIKSLHLAHTAPEPDRDSVYPTPLSAWPNQQFSRTTPLVPTTVDPAAATTTNLSYPTPISARPHLPHRTSSTSTHPSAYTPHTPTGQPALHTFQASSFHYVPPTTAESTTSTTSSGRNPSFVDDTRTTTFGHDRTGPTAGFAHEGRTTAASAFTQEGRPAFGHERTASGSGYPNTSERQRYPTHQNQNHDVRYSHDPRYPPSQSQETRYQSQDTRYPATQSQDPRYAHPPSDPRYTQSQSQPQSQNPDPRYPSTQAQTPSQPRDPSQQQQPDDRSVYTPAEARAGGYAPVQSSPEIRSVYPPDGRTTYTHTQDTRGGYASDPRYAPSQDPRYASDMRYPQEARGAYAADVNARNTYTQPQDPRYPPDARSYTTAPDARGYPPSQTNPELDGRGYVAPAQDARSVYPAQEARAASAYSAAPVQDPRSTYAPQTQTQSQAQDSRGYAPPPQHPVPQPQAQPQEPRYTATGQEPRNTFPPSSHPQSQAYVAPTQTQPPSQDGRGYAPAVPSEQRNYAHTDVHVRGYPHSERGAGTQQLHQQVPYSHAPPDAQTQTGRNPSVLDSQPQTQAREQQAQPQGQTRATERSGGFDPRAVEVRPGGLQRQPVTVLEARPGALEARVGPAVLEPHGRSQVALEGPGRPTGLVAPSQGTQRGVERIGKDDIVREIVQHCTTLYKFANHYAHVQTSTPLLLPSPEELAEMMARAGEVVRLLEALRNDTPIFPSTLFSSASASNTLIPVHSLDAANAMGAVKGVGLGMTIMDVDAPDRAPKRPWEDVEGMLVPGSTGTGPAGSSAPQPSAQGNMDQDRSTAEADMELIRRKRAITTMAATALGTGGGGTAGGKNKYRKRSRATPPGKCHSCNIRETPEWRRGPDGARTLCNACGLHYAKLVRKRDKALANGETPSIQQIDMEMLRASARAAEGEKLARAALGGGSTGGGATVAAGNTGNAGGGDEKMNLGIHQGSFQINTDAGEPMQDQEVTPQATASYSRPPTSRPTTSKRLSSSRVMQSPGIPNQHQPASSSSHHPAVPHHSSTPGPHLLTPSISHHQTPVMSTTPSTHQTNTSASTSRHPAPPAVQPASQQNQTHHPPPTGPAHHQPTSAQAHHPPQVQHPPPSLHRPGPPPTPPWYLSPHPQPHSMLRQ